MPRFLGIDESNHGRYPEIIVAVLSQDPADFEKGSFGKKRTFKHEGYQTPGIENIIENREFMQIIITERQSQFSYYHVQANAIAAFVNYFGNLDSVIVDGSLSHETHDKLKEALPKGVPSRIEGKIDADKNFLLVNLADQLAYILSSNCRLVGLEKYKAAYADTILPLELEVQATA